MSTEVLSASAATWSDDPNAFELPPQLTHPGGGMRGLATRFRIRQRRAEEVGHGELEAPVVRRQRFAGGLQHRGGGIEAHHAEAGVGRQGDARVPSGAAAEIEQSFRPLEVEPLEHA